MEKPVVLFLCTGNSARSQMAEAFLKKYAGDQYEVLSAGLEPKGLNPLTVRVMNEIGVDMTGHRSKSLSEFLGKVHIRWAITVCDHAERSCPYVWPFAPVRRFWPFEDPAACEGCEETRLEKFRTVRDEIDAKVKSWIAEQRLAEVG